MFFLRLIIVSSILLIHAINPEGIVELLRLKLLVSENARIGSRRLSPETITKPPLA
ncbi:hypothetical protein D3C72_2439270 [compost metagenome]